MAEGAWIPVFDSIWTSPKTKALARELRIRADTAAGLFLRVLMHARDHVESGDLGGVPVDTLATWAGIGGDFDIYRAKADLLPAMKKAKLVTDDDRAHVVGWEDGPGKLAAKRARERERKAEDRRRDAAERDAKRRQREVDEARQKRIDEARVTAGSNIRAVASHSASTPRALPEHSTSTPPSTPEVSAGQPPEPPANTPLMGEGDEARPRDVRSQREEKRDIPPSPPDNRRRTGLRKVEGSRSRPLCGRCRDEWFVHRSQVNDPEARYEGDCSPCARRGTRCAGYTSEVLDPDIPDERKANA